MLSGLLGPVRELEPLPSGTGGLSYLATCDSARYVAKLFSADGGVLLGPCAQYALLGALAGRGIA